MLWSSGTMYKHYIWNVWPVKCVVDFYISGLHKPTMWSFVKTKSYTWKQKYKRSSSSAVILYNIRSFIRNQTPQQLMLKVLMRRWPSGVQRSLCHVQVFHDKFQFWVSGHRGGGKLTRWRGLLWGELSRIQKSSRWEGGGRGEGCLRSSVRLQIWTP